LFTLTVVEPMMVGIIGGGMAAYPYLRRRASFYRWPKHRAFGGSFRHLHIEAGFGA